MSSRDITGLADVILTAILVFAILFVGGFVASNAADVGGAGGQTTTESYQDALLPSADSVTLSGSNITDVTVRQSLNDSADLDGSGDISGALGDDVAADRTVSTWVQIDNTTGVRQVVSIDSRTILVYNGSASEWACWSYDDSSGETHRAAVSDASPGGWSNLQCERAAGSLTLRVNDTSTATVQTDSANATAQTLQTTPLDGRVDETRVFNGTLTTSEQSALYSSPTAPLESAPRQSRVMYDSYDSLDSIPVYFAGGSLDGTAATKTAGLDGQGAIEGADWSISGDTISLLTGGTLEGAPVVFVDWLAAGAALVSIAPEFGAALVLAGLVPLLLVVGFVLKILNNGR